MWNAELHEIGNKWINRIHRLFSEEKFLQILWFEFSFHSCTLCDCWIIYTCFLGHGYGLKMKNETWMCDASLCVYAFENVAFDRLSLTWHMITSKTHYTSFCFILFNSIRFYSIPIVCSFVEQVCKCMRSFAICIILLLNAIPLEHVNVRYMTLSIKITKNHIVFIFIKPSCQSESFEFLINCLKLQHCWKLSGLRFFLRLEVNFNNK